MGEMQRPTVTEARPASQDLTFLSSTAAGCLRVLRNGRSEWVTTEIRGDFEVEDAALWWRWSSSSPSHHKPLGRRCHSHQRCF